MRPPGRRTTERAQRLWCQNDASVRLRRTSGVHRHPVDACTTIVGEFLAHGDACDNVVRRVDKDSHRAFGEVEGGVPAHGGIVSVL